MHPVCWMLVGALGSWVGAGGLLVWSASSGLPGALDEAGGVAEYQAGYTKLFGYMLMHQDSLWGIRKLAMEYNGLDTEWEKAFWRIQMRLRMQEFLEQTVEFLVDETPELFQTFQIEIPGFAADGTPEHEQTGTPEHEQTGTPEQTGPPAWVQCAHDADAAWL